jgi:EAL domain-containing protein (putative c-di-GMP-specific phosphodiesterase class I)
MKPAPQPANGDESSAVFPAFTMAFQPIVDIDTATVYAYEALVRPLGGGSAAEVLDRMNDQNRYAFDQRCRVKAIELAARLELDGFLSINFLPNAVYESATCLERTLDSARRAQFPLHHLIFEITENEPTKDIRQFKEIFSQHKRHGMITAIDDFGAGHSGLNMLAEFQPDIIKIDMELTRGIHVDSVRRSIARAIISLCKDLKISVIAEGVETVEEAVTLRSLGVSLFQGYLFAKPAIERLPRIAAGSIDAVHAAHEASLAAGGDPYGEPLEHGARRAG